MTQPSSSNENWYPANDPRETESEANNFHRSESARWRWHEHRYQDPGAQEEERVLENGVPMQVMKMMGLPRGYRHALYTGFVEDVKELASLPTNFVNLISWIYGGSDGSEQEVKVNEGLGTKASNDSILTHTDSRILTPYSLSTADLKKTGSNNSIPKRLPSLVLLNPSPSLLGREITVYSCEVSEDKVNPPEAVKSILSTSSMFDEVRSALEKKVTFAAEESECELYTQHQLEQEKAEEGGHVDENGNTSLSEAEAEIPHVTRTLPAAPETTDKPIPGTTDKPQSGTTDMPQSGTTDGIQSGTTDKPQSGLGLSETDIQSIKEILKKAEEVTVTPALPLINQTNPFAFPPPNLPEDDAQPKAGRSTSELQLDLNKDLRTLEEVVKKLYKSLNKKGPLTIVASFQPKLNGELGMNIEASNNSRPASATSATSASSEASGQSPNRPPSTLKIDSECAETDDYEALSIKIMSTKPKSDNKSKLEKEPPRPCTMKSIPSNNKSKSMYISQNSSMAILNARPFTRGFTNSSAPVTVFPVTSIARDDNNNALASILKPNVNLNKTTIFAKPINNLTPSTTEYSGTSGQEDFRRRPQTSVNTYKANVELIKPKRSTSNLEERPKRVTLEQPKPKHKSPQRHHNTHHHNQQNAPVDNWYYSNPKLGNIRVVKACELHENTGFPPYPKHLEHEFGEHTQESSESDSSSGSGSSDSTSEDATTTAAEIDELRIENALNYDPNYSQRPVTRSGSFLGEVLATTKSQGSLTRQSPQKKNDKYNPPVYIQPNHLQKQSGSTTSTNSYRDMFREKTNQKQQQKMPTQTVYVDLTRAGRNTKSKHQPLQIQVGNSRSRNQFRQ